MFVLQCWGGGLKTDGTVTFTVPTTGSVLIIEEKNGRCGKNTLVKINVVFWLTRCLRVIQQMSHGVRGVDTRLDCNDLVGSVRNLSSDSRPCHSSFII